MRPEHNAQLLDILQQELDVLFQDGLAQDQGRGGEIRGRTADKRAGRDVHCEYEAGCTRKQRKGLDMRPGYKAAEMRGAIPRRPHSSHGSYLIGSGSVGVHSPNSFLYTYRLNGL